MQKFIYKALKWLPGLIFLFIIACIFFEIYIPGGWGVIPLRPLGWHKDLFWLELCPMLMSALSLVLIVFQFDKLRKFDKRTKSSFSLKVFWTYLLKLPRRYIVPLLASSMLLTWSIGWGLYVCALWSNYSSDSNIAEILGYAAMSATDLFFFNINGNILDNIGEGIDLSYINFSVLKGGIALVALLASFLSLMLVIKLFLQHLLVSINNSKINIKKNNFQHVYIFLGINDKSIHLANSIKGKKQKVSHKEDDLNDFDTQNEGDSLGLVVFVDFISVDETETDGFGNIVAEITPTNSKLSSIEIDNRTVYLSTSTILKEVEDDENLWINLGLEKIQKLFEELSADDKKEDKGINDKKIHFFLISDNRDNNVADSVKIAKNLNIISNKNKNFKNIEKFIYCQTRKDAVTSVIEDSRTDLDANVEVIVLDESVMAVEQLKENVKFHPVSFIKIENSDPEKLGYAQKNSKFTSLIVGFGETGRDALRFLYEFGAFLDASSEDEKRSLFNCYVIDKNMEELRSHFIANNPALKPVSSFFMNGGNSMLYFLNSTDRDEQYYQLLKSIARDLNYVVVAVGDDETNITVAVNLIRYVRRFRKNLINFKVLVRAYQQDTFTHLKGIAEHYNGIWKNTEAGGQDVIEIFGGLDSLFTYKNIIENDFRREAEKYYDNYNRISFMASDIKSYQQNGIIVKSWKERRRDALKSDSCSQIDKLRVMESQDFSNAWHALTKIKVIEEVFKFQNKVKDCTPDLLKLKNYMFRNNSWSPYRISTTGTEYQYPDLEEVFDTPQLKWISRFLTNMAKTEHLRWIAAMETLGYTFQGPELKDDIVKAHKCMVSWDKLPKITTSNKTRLYDYLVVETSIKLRIKSKPEIDFNN